MHIPAELDDPDDRDSDLIPRAFGQLLIDEMAMFPNGRFRDMTDSTTQAMKHLRGLNLLIRRDEREERRLMAGMHYAQPQPLYDV